MFFQELLRGLTNDFPTTMALVGLASVLAYSVVAVIALASVVYYLYKVVRTSDTKEAAEAELNFAFAGWFTTWWAYVVIDWLEALLQVIKNGLHIG